MKLYEYLIPIGFDTPVFIFNMERPPKGRHQYQKMGNVRWEKIRNILNYDVYGVSVSKDGGLFIKVGRKEDTRQSLNNWDLVDKYFHRLEQRREQGLST